MDQQPDLARRRLLFAGLALGVVTPAAAQNILQATYGSRYRGDPQVHALLMTGSLALRTSTVALQRSAIPEIRAFAQSEIAEQQQISTAVTGAPRLAPLGPREKAILAEAESLPAGPAADRRYLERQLEGHQQLRALAEGYASTGSDPRIVAVARGSLPLIYRHLEILSGLYRTSGT